MNKSPQYKFMIEVKGLEKKFGFKSALRKIDLYLKEGDFLALYGPNGAGKTTLIQILCSLLRPSSGKACVAGFDTRHDRQALCRTVGVILHNTFLYHNLSAFENLKFYGRMYGVTALNKKIERLMEMVGLNEYRDEQVQTFSRGMQQRLSLARAIIHDPPILFLDEPNAGLDQQGAEDLKQILWDFRNQGKTVIMTTHDLSTGLELCNRAAILKSGSLVYEGDISEIRCSDFKHVYLKHTQEKEMPLQVSL
jgi:heme exporter protein A